MKRSSTDSIVYNTLLNIAFAASAVISGVLNFIMFTNLSHDTVWLLGSMSITLECMKIVTLLRKNTYESLYKKVPSKKLNSKKNFYFCVYLFFAALAIFASIGFSLRETHATQVSSSSEVITYTNQINAVQAQEDLVKKYDTDYENKLSLFKQYDETDTNAQIARRNALANNDVETRKAQDLIIQNNKYNLTTSKKDMTDAKAKLDTESSKLSSMKSQFGEVWQLQQKLQDAKNKQIAEEGSSGMFTLIADTFHISAYAEQLKFIILLLISVLIELTIYMTSTDVNLDKALLHKFRKDLPENIDINDLIKKIEAEQDLYATSSSLKLSAADKRAIKAKIDEAKDKAYEEASKKFKRIIDTTQDDSLRTELSYKGKIKELEDIIDSYKAKERAEKITEEETVKVEKKQKKVKPIQVEEIIEPVEEPAKETIEEPAEENIAPVEETVEPTKEPVDIVSSNNTVKAEFSAEPVLEVSKKETSKEEIDKAIEDAMNSMASKKEEIHELTAEDFKDEDGRTIKPAETEIEEMLNAGNGNRKVFHI